jgi:mannose-6-phosphate isomerase
MPVHKLTNPLKCYDWGSEDFIPGLLNIKPEINKTVAEMWMGAHPSASSLVESEDGNIPLAELIASQPDATLGISSHLDGNRLPYLFKVLAATKPLSIQAHPSKAQARLGFDRENNLSIPLDSPQRNYKDPNHKPELLCALTPFQALCGFRSYDQIIRNFASSFLSPLFSTYPAMQKFPDQLHWQKLFVELLYLSEERAALVCNSFEKALDADITFTDDVRTACRLLLRAFPNDAGALAPLYLNVFNLQPGEALFLPAGVPHAYLNGAGVELMANSDNVLRGGLTSKHIDREELTRVLDFSPYKGDKVLPVRDGLTEKWLCPAEEFQLQRLTLTTGEEFDFHNSSLPSIMLCSDGVAVINSPQEQISLLKGESVFVTANTPALAISGTATLWIATLPTAQN